MCRSIWEILIFNVEEFRNAPAGYPCSATENKTKFKNNYLRLWKYKPIHYGIPFPSSTRPSNHQPAPPSSTHQRCVYKNQMTHSSKWPITFSDMMCRTKTIVQLKYSPLIFLRKANVVISKIALKQVIFSGRNCFFRRCMVVPTSLTVSRRYSTRGENLYRFPVKSAQKTSASERYHQTDKNLDTALLASPVFETSR